MFGLNRISILINVFEAFLVNPGLGNHSIIGPGGKEQGNAHISWGLKGYIFYIPSPINIIRKRRKTIKKRRKKKKDKKRKRKEEKKIKGENWGKKYYFK